MTKSALDRIDEYKAECSRRRKIAVKIIVPALGLCFAAAICVGVWRSGMFEKDTGLSQNDTVDNPLTEQNPIAEETVPEKIITKDDVDQKGTSVDTSDNCLFWWKNKLTMDGALYNAIETDPDGIFAVYAAYRPATANITSFTYEEKTLAELAVAADNESLLPEKMNELLKVGDELKYGDALYKTGTPSGEKWTEELYKKTIDYFGEELLGKYIVNGEFLKDALTKDVANIGNTARAKYKRAYAAYMETVLSKVLDALSKSGIKCERAPYSNSAIVFTATVKDLEDLPLEDIENWRFGLSSSDLKGPADAIADLQTVK